MDKINENLDLINSIVLELKEEYNRQNQTIKGLEWQIKEIDHSRMIWYNKCLEYEKLLFENKIPYEDLPFFNF